MGSTINPHNSKADPKKAAQKKLCPQLKSWLTAHSSKVVSNEPVSKGFEMIPAWMSMNIGMYAR